MDTRALIDRTKLWLNFNEDQTDQDFSEAQILSVLNMVLTEECSLAKQEGARSWFRTSTEFTWAASEVTLTLPEPLSRVSMYRLVDVTDTTGPGARILFSQEGFTGDVFWKTRTVLQWGSTGPASERTLRAYYFATPEELVTDLDIPELIPDEFHELLPLSAAVVLRTMADDAAPQAWLMKQRDYRNRLWKFMSRGRPLDDIPSGELYEEDFDVGEVW